jgi:hypothetical protein
LTQRIATLQGIIWSINPRKIISGTPGDRYKITIERIKSAPKVCQKLADVKRALGDSSRYQEKSVFPRAELRTLATMIFQNNISNSWPFETVIRTYS